MVWKGDLWSQSDEEQLNALLQKYRKTHPSVRDTRFDISLVEGQVNEQRLQNAKIEVKSDYKVSATGNVFIETQSGGKDSGVNVTEADYVAVLLEGKEYRGEVIVLITPKRLKHILGLRKFPRRTQLPNGEKRAGFLVPVKALLTTASDINKVYRQRERERNNDNRHNIRD